MINGPREPGPPSSGPFGADPTDPLREAHYNKLNEERFLDMDRRRHEELVDRGLPEPNPVSSTIPNDDRHDIDIEAEASVPSAEYPKAQPVSGISSLEQDLAKARDEGNQQLIGHCLISLGVMSAGQGQILKGIRYLSEAKQIQESLGEWDRVALCCKHLASCYELGLNDLATAVKYMEIAATVAVRDDFRRDYRLHLEGMQERLQKGFDRQTPAPHARETSAPRVATPALSTAYFAPSNPTSNYASASLASASSRASANRGETKYSTGCLVLAFLVFPWLWAILILSDAEAHATWVKVVAGIVLVMAVIGTILMLQGK